MNRLKLLALAAVLTGSTWTLSASNNNENEDKEASKPKAKADLTLGVTNIHYRMDPTYINYEGGLHGVREYFPIDDTTSGFSGSRYALHFGFSLRYNTNWIYGVDLAVGSNASNISLGAGYVFGDAWESNPGFIGLVRADFSFFEITERHDFDGQTARIKNEVGGLQLTAEIRQHVFKNFGIYARFSVFEPLFASQFLEMQRNRNFITEYDNVPYSSYTLANPKSDGRWYNINYIISLGMVLSL